MLRPITKKEKIKAEKSIRIVQGNSNTICEHIRVIFWTAEDEIRNKKTKAKILEECKIIFAYAKRMNARLVEYSQGKNGI